MAVSFDSSYPFAGVEEITGRSFKSGEWLTVTRLGNGSRIELITHGRQRIDNLRIRLLTNDEARRSEPKYNEPTSGYGRYVKFVSSADKSHR